MTVSERSYFAWGVGILLGVGISCGIYFGFFRDPVLAKIGSTKIYQSDVQFRDRLIFLSFPEEKRSMGLHQLIRSAVHLEILKKYGIPFSEAVLDMEEQRIDRDTKSPEQLKKIKDIFGENKKAYRRVYVLPTLVDRVIYFDFFLTDEKIHDASMKAAMDLISKVRGQEKRFQEIAGTQGLRTQKLKVSFKDGVVWETPKMPDVPPVKPAKMPPGIVPTIPPNEEAKKWYDLFLQNLKVGDVAPIPVSYGNDLLVVHYLKNPRPQVFDLEVAVIPKIEFGPWLEKEKAALKIEVYDKSYTQKP